MAFLQGAFESYKSQSEAENQRDLADLKVRLEKNYEETLQTRLQDLGTCTLISIEQYIWCIYLYICSILATLWTYTIISLALTLGNLMSPLCNCSLVISMLYYGSCVVLGFAIFQSNTLTHTYLHRKLYLEAIFSQQPL